MNYLLLIISLFTLFLSGCDEAVVGDTEVEETIQWLGVLEEEPEEPYINSVYFDLELKITRIFNGETWDTMSVSGIDGASIDWLGPLSFKPLMGTKNKAFYHIGDRVSYIYNVKTNDWDTLNITGKDGLGMEWLGVLDKAPAAEEMELKANMAYYDKFLKKSFIYSGTDWELLSADGVDGLSIIWKGELDTWPEEDLNVAFYHTGDRVSYLFDGTAWQIIAKDGTIGVDGEIILWQGNLSEEPENPGNNWAYYNTLTGSSFIYSEAEGKWFTLSRAGAHGTAIIWLEETYPSHPDLKILNAAYRNSTDGNCYIFNGESWEMLSKGGGPGSKGVDGVDVVWQGTFTEHPDPAELNWGYFNKNEGCSYIYNGTEWDTLLLSGQSGFQLNWMGEFYSEPTIAEPFSVYYNKLDGNSWIYNAYNRWVIFCKGGYQGKDGKNILWKGACEGYPSGYAEDGWLFYDLTDNQTKVYRAYRWRVIAKDGIDGNDGIANYISLTDTVAGGEKLYLNHNYGTTDIILNGEYLGSDGMFHPWDEPSADWDNFYSQELNLPLYESAAALQRDNLLKLKDGTLIHYFSTDEGGKYAAVDGNGVMGELKPITSYPVTIRTALETSDGTLLFLCTNSADASTVIIRITPEGVSETVLGKSETAPQMVLRKDGSLFMAYRGSDNRGYFRSIAPDGTVSAPVQFAELLDQDFALTALEDGNTLVAFSHVNVVKICFIGADNSTLYERNYESVKSRGVVKCAQADDGSLYIHSERLIGVMYTTRYEHSIVKLSVHGDSIASCELGARKDRVDFTILPDNRIAVMNIGRNYRPYQSHSSFTGYPDFELYSESLKLEKSYRLDEEIAYADIECLEDGRIAFTYLNKFNRDEVKIGTLKSGDEHVSLNLVRENSNRAYLENATGGTVIMRISARRM